MGRVQVRGSFAAVGLALAIGAGGVACGSDKKADEDPFVGAAEVCDGLFAGPLAKKVESATGDTVFFRSGTKGLENVVEALKRGHADRRSWTTMTELCRLSPKGGKQGAGGRLSFLIYAPRDVEDPYIQDGVELYAMGKKANVTRGGAGVFLECVSPQVKGSSENPLRIYGNFKRGENDAPDTRELRDANVEILHAASLAVVKELDCENNAGLPEKPILKPGQKLPEKKQPE